MVKSSVERLLTDSTNGKHQERMTINNEHWHFSLACEHCVNCSMTSQAAMNLDTIIKNNSSFRFKPSSSLHHLMVWEGGGILPCLPVVSLCKCHSTIKCRRTPRHALSTPASVAPTLAAKRVQSQKSFCPKSFEHPGPRVHYRSEATQKL